MISARPTPSVRTIAIRAALVLAGSALLALSAQIAVPMLPVPITMQTLAVPLLVLALGRNLAVAATVTYLLEGAAGLPVFAPIHTAIPAFIGPTAGYLFMYPVAAYVTGSLLERTWTKTYAGRWLAVFLGTGSVFLGGVAWLVAGYHLSLAQATAVGVTPFIIGDLLKTSLAAALPPQAAKLAARLGL